MLCNRVGDLNISQRSLLHYGIFAYWHLYTRWFILACLFLNRCERCHCVEATLMTGSVSTSITGLCFVVVCIPMFPCTAYTMNRREGINICFLTHPFVCVLSMSRATKQKQNFSLRRIRGNCTLSDISPFLPLLCILIVFSFARHIFPSFLLRSPRRM